jgi:hypothetical protein
MNLFRLSKKEARASPPNARPNFRLPARHDFGGNGNLLTLRLFHSAFGLSCTAQEFLKLSRDALAVQVVR